MSVIQEIIAYKKIELPHLKTQLQDFKVQHMGGFSPQAKSLLEKLRSKEKCFIFEIKPSSPALGVIQHNLDVEALITAYEKHAVAISVLTDTRYFGGSFALLERCALLTQKPLLCKDFIVDELQLDLAQKSGATAVLLIVKSLTDSKLAELYKKALQRGLLPFVEVNDMHEVHCALEINPDIILINNRNLDTLEIDMENTSKIVGLIPSDIAVISASGISTPEHVEKLSKYSSNFLVGSSLMVAPVNELESKIKVLVGGKNGFDTP